MLHDGQVKIMQGVREVFEIIDAPDGAEAAPGQGKIVLIGKQVQGVDFEQSLKAAIS